jgi:hypothetical protein
MDLMHQHRETYCVSICFQKKRISTMCISYMSASAQLSVSYFAEAVLKCAALFQVFEVRLGHHLAA